MPNKFLLDILELLKKGYNPSKICIHLNISKQKLNYHLAILKREGLVKKIGYGVWEVNEVKNQEKLSQDTSKKSNTISVIELRELLRKYNKLQCIFCTSNLVHIHHIKPRSEGGRDTFDNLIPVCPNHHSLIHLNGYNEFMLKRLEEYQISIQNLKQAINEKVKEIRGHAFIWKVRFNLKYNWKDILNSKQINYSEVGLQGTPRIILNNRKIWLGKSNIIVYFNTEDSLFAINSIESKKLAIFHLLDTIRALESHLGLNLGKFRFTSTREHYSLIKNSLAIQCDKEGKKY